MKSEKKEIFVLVEQLVETCCFIMIYLFYYDKILFIVLYLLVSN